MRGADFVTLQKKHDIFDFFLLLPACFNPVYTNFPYPLYRKQFIRSIFYDIQRIFPKFLHNSFCEFRTNSFDQTGTQIFFNSVYCSGECFFKFLYGKLPPISGIHLPYPFQRQYRANMGIRHCANYRNKITVIFHRTFQDCIAIVCILICNSLNYTTQVLHIRLLSPSYK